MIYWPAGFAAFRRPNKRRRISVNRALKLHQVAVSGSENSRHRAGGVVAARRDYSSKEELWHSDYYEPVRAKGKAGIR